MISIPESCFRVRVVQPGCVGIAVWVSSGDSRGDFADVDPVVLIRPPDRPEFFGDRPFAGFSDLVHEGERLQAVDLLNECVCLVCLLHRNRFLFLFQVRRHLQHPHHLPAT